MLHNPVKCDRLYPVCSHCVLRKEECDLSTFSPNGKAYVAFLRGRLHWAKADPCSCLHAALHPQTFIGSKLLVSRSAWVSRPQLRKALGRS